ncbi:MAG: ThiF family adenylyltransferase, partial [Lactococcus cremoris]
ISKNFDKFRMFMRNNWAISKRKYQISSNRGTIIDSQLLGSLGARSIINHVCALNQNDRVIEINLLDITMRDVPFR